MIMQEAYAGIIIARECAVWESGGGGNVDEGDRSACTHCEYVLRNARCGFRGSSSLNTKTAR
jgi:hypothetical protein